LASPRVNFGFGRSSVEVSGFILAKMRAILVPCKHFTLNKLDISKWYQESRIMAQAKTKPAFVIGGKLGPL
jgi:hypothetical protein